ncbi:MAG TPA: metal ABC transporter permease [archaeon]|nr:metal ABC transporter permease [archaeon]
MEGFFLDLKTHAFLQHALLAGVLSGLACGVVGSYVVTRRISYIAGGIAHCVLGGIGAARYFQEVHGWKGFEPLYGALAAALLAAVIIGLVTLRAAEREDTAISALWALGMAAGIIFISQTPGYSADLVSYLFGNILLVGVRDLVLLGFLDALVVGLALFFYNGFLAVCFDEEFVRLRGVPASFYYLLLLALVALTVVILVSVVGIVLVIALLTLPAAVAGRFTKTLWGMMALATALSVAFTTGGLALSYGPNLPAGATTIVLAGLVYLAVTLGARLVKVKKNLYYHKKT